MSNQVFCLVFVCKNLGNIKKISYLYKIFERNKYYKKGFINTKYKEAKDDKKGKTE